MELASKMQLLQGSNHSLLLLKNQSIGAVQSATLRRSRSADATSESSRLRIQLGIRDGVVCSAHNNSSSPLSTNQDGPAFSGNFHGSSVKENRRTSQLCQVLRSALEAQALTQRPTDTSRAHQDRSESELPLRNEEAEDVVRVPIGNLRALLRLWDIDNKTNYHELLAVADYLERLGLDVYFREEVTAILQRVFRVWTENSPSKTAEILGDLQVVGLAFFLLRSHEYDVEPSIFELYKKEDGSFCKTPQRGSGDTVASADVVDLLNLLRASDLKFSRDSILHDATKFARTALNSLLDGAEPLSEKTSAEVKYRLSYHWAFNFRMLETRHTILNFEVESVTARFSSARLSSEVIALMLSTATQLFNHYHKVFQHELDDCKRWSEESGLAEVNIRPQMIVCPFLLSISYEMPQARYAYTREVWSKVWYIIIFLDDLYEGSSSSNMDEILIFMDAFRQHDPSILEKIPKSEDKRYKFMKAVYYAMYDLTKSWAQESSKWYGRDLLRTFIDTWMIRLEVYLNEKIWAEENYKFTVEQYVEEYAPWSFAADAGIPLGYYAIPGYAFSPSFLETRPDMKSIFAISKAARFFNDARSYEIEKDIGKPEFVGLLMKENPGLTEADALNKTQEVAISALEEATEALLLGRLPYEAKQIVLVTFRIFILLYYSVDGLRNEDWPLSKLCDPLPTLTAEN